VQERATLGTLPRPGERIDRYDVIAEVAHGGMAAVYAVRRSSIGGFDKTLAMKVLLPHLRSERRFVEMFLDEARIASTIQHPNVVHVFDLGEHDGSPFMVMEFLRGQSLNRILKKTRQGGPRLPLGLLCRVLADSASGLHAAHETRGADGEPLNVVHRDVSPQNIHVGYDGQVKIVDFGIAAARGRIAATRTGEVKGKLTYLSPEQIDRSSPVDRRTDIWALGVVAWELFARRRLFKAEDDGTRIWKIMNMEIPDLRAAVPGVPRAVAEVVMRCLERAPAARPATCQQIATVLDRAARELGGDSTAELSNHVSTLFAAEKAVEEERLAAALREGPPPPLVEGDPTSEPSLSAVRTRSEQSVVAIRDSRWRRLAVAGVALVALLAGVGFYALGSPPDAPASAPGPDDTTHGPASSAPAKTVTEPTPDPDPSPPTALPATPQAPAPSARSITVRVDEAARLVLVDGERREGNPLVIALGEDGRAEVELVARDGRIVRREVTEADDGSSLAFEPETEPASRGTRSVRGTRDGRNMGMRALIDNPY